MIVAPTTEPHIDPLSTRLRPGLEDPAVERYLHTSPELALKRALAHGVTRCFCLSHVFRDGESGARHNPEFTMLEWYRLDYTLEQLIAEVIALLTELMRTRGMLHRAPDTTHLLSDRWLPGAG